MLVRYCCSRECQLGVWREHKKTCTVERAKQKQKQKQKEEDEKEEEARVNGAESKSNNCTST